MRGLLCTSCGQRFLSKSSFRVHRIQKHPETFGSRANACEPEQSDHEAPQQMDGCQREQPLEDKQSGDAQKTSDRVTTSQDSPEESENTFVVDEELETLEREVQREEEELKILVLEHLTQSLNPEGNRNVTSELPQPDGAVRQLPPVSELLSSVIKTNILGPSTTNDDTQKVTESQSSRGNDHDTQQIPESEVFQGQTSNDMFNCAICHRPFKGKDTYIAHMKTIHDSINTLGGTSIVSFGATDPYQCLFCMQRFRTKPRLEAHVTTFHNVASSRLHLHQVGRPDAVYGQPCTFSGRTRLQTSNMSANVSGQKEQHMRQAGLEYVTPSNTAGSVQTPNITYLPMVAPNALLDEEAWISRYTPSLSETHSNQSHHRLSSQDNPRTMTTQRMQTSFRPANQSRSLPSESYGDIQSRQAYDANVRANENTATTGGIQGSIKHHHRSNGWPTHLNSLPTNHLDHWALSQPHQQSYAGLSINSYDLNNTSQPSNNSALGYGHVLPPYESTLNNYNAVRLTGGNSPMSIHSDNGSLNHGMHTNPTSDQFTTPKHSQEIMFSRKRLRMMRGYEQSRSDLDMRSHRNIQAVSTHARYNVGPNVCRDTLFTNTYPGVSVSQISSDDVGQMSGDDIIEVPIGGTDTFQQTSQGQSVQLLRDDQLLSEQAIDHLRRQNLESQRAVSRVAVDENRFLEKDRNVNVTSGQGNEQTATAGSTSEAVVQHNSGNALQWQDSPSVSADAKESTPTANTLVSQVQKLAAGNDCQPEIVKKNPKQIHKPTDDQSRENDVTTTFVDDSEQSVSSETTQQYPPSVTSTSSQCPPDKTLSAATRNKVPTRELNQYLIPDDNGDYYPLTRETESVAAILNDETIPTNFKTPRNVAYFQHLQSSLYNQQQKQLFSPPNAQHYRGDNRVGLSLPNSVSVRDSPNTALLHPDHETYVISETIPNKRMRVTQRHGTDPSTRDIPMSPLTSITTGEAMGSASVPDGGTHFNQHEFHRSGAIRGNARPCLQSPNLNEYQMSRTFSRSHPLQRGVHGPRVEPTVRGGMSPAQVEYPRGAPVTATHLFRCSVCYQSFKTFLHASRHLTAHSGFGKNAQSYPGVQTMFPVAYGTCVGDNTGKYTMQTFVMEQAGVAQVEILKSLVSLPVRRKFHKEFIVPIKLTPATVD